MVSATPIQATISNMLRAPQIFFAKSSIKRVLLPMSIDIDTFRPNDYEKIIPTLKEIDERLERVPLNKAGMRWIHQNNTTYFYGQRRFELPYDEFISRVNVCHAGEFYRDSVSVDTLVIEKDEQQRPIRQAVRVVALPQPNYAAFLGKGNLDVYKLEKIDYTQDFQKLWMLTVHSPNGSAICDDGYLCFQKLDQGQATQVSFMACQHFPVPPLMAMIYLDRWQWLKRVLTEDAYRRFFNTMMDNIWANFQGVDHHIGRI